MLSQDGQRLLRGLMQIAQEFAKYQSHELRVATELYQKHAQDIAGQIRRAGPSIVHSHNSPDPSNAKPAQTHPTSTYTDSLTQPRRNRVYATLDTMVVAPRVSGAAASPLSMPSAAVEAPASTQTHIEVLHTPNSSASAVQTPAPVSTKASTLSSDIPSVPPLPQLASATPRKREFRERAVPASPLARIFGFGSMAASMAVGAAGEALQRGLGLGDQATTATSTAKIGMSEAQAERLAEGLCRMRGAALKIGQMLSLTDETLLPPQIAAVLERVRMQADIMPKRQLNAVMTEELGQDWRERLGGPAFQETPVAAASIGQVHRSTLHDGTQVAIKVQYPGVAESINSDLSNLKRLLTVANVFPKGLYIDSVIQVAKEELTAECDYRREAEAQQLFKRLLADDPDFEVPAVVPELSARRVLTSTWLDGMPIDQVVELGYPQDIRNDIARKLLRLTLRELFEWRYMQTDPNWGNFFYNPSKKVIGLLDFGAAKEYPKPFVDDYLRLVWAAANRDRKTIEEVSIKLGFLTGLETKAMLDAHIDSGLVVGEPFVTREPFDFKASGITARVSKHGATFAEHRLTPPPNEVYSLHRKLAGAFFICIRMGAVIPCRDLLEKTFNEYKWG